MLPKIGTFTFHIESYLCDFQGKVTLPIIGNYILQAATMHAQERGFGYEDISKDNAAWVLSRLSVEMNEYPGYDQDFRVETWVEDVNRFFTNRCFAFSNAEGKIIGYARSIWAAIDIRTRRPIDIPEWRPDLIEYADKDKYCPVEKPGKIPEINKDEPVMGYSIRYSDIDINVHMNSVKYIEHAINIFDLKKFEEKSIARFEMVYLSEGAFGDKLKLYCEQVSATEDIIDTRKGDVSICRCRINWK